MRHHFLSGDLGLAMQIADRDFESFAEINVPKAGLEPAQLAPHASETCVSTSFTTSAKKSKFKNSRSGFELLIF